MGKRERQMGYDKDIRLEVRFATQIKGVLGATFVQQNPVLDKNEGSDFVVFTLMPIRVACRLRTFGFLERYPNDFTIRWSRPSGAETEIHKVRKRLVDYLFYGFVNMDETKIVRYFIGDLGIFLNCGIKPYEIKKNTKPYDSELAAYRLSDLPKEFVIKQYTRVQQ